MNLYYRIILFVFCNISFIYIRANNDSIAVQKQLKTITVSKIKAKNESVSLFPDKLVQQGNSLNDILLFFPSLENDMEGNIRLRGSEKITFLIDGKPTSLFGDYRSEMMIQLPGSAIGQIKIDYAPDVSRPAEGSAGTIDLSLKKMRQGQVYLSGANNDRYMAGTHLGYSLSPYWQFNAGIDYKREYRKRSFLNTIASRENGIVTNEQIQDNSAVAHPQTVIGTLGSEMNKDKHTFSTNFSFIQMWFDRTGNIHNTETKKELRVVRDNEQKNRQYSANAFYRYKHNEQTSISVDINYRQAIYDEDNDYRRNVLRPQTNLIQDRLFINQKNNEYELNLTGRFGDFKSGYNAWLTTSNNTNLKEIFKDNAFSKAPDETFNLDLNRYIHALFLQYEKQWQKWFIYAGVRGEYTHQSVYTAEGNDRIKQDYWNVFPAFQLSYNNQQYGHSWQISYRQRINRPVFSELNPFLNQSDPQEIIQGNPYLKPEISHNISSGYSYTHKKFIFTPALFYRIREQAIAQIMKEDMVVTYDNLYHNQSEGIELSTFIFPVKWMDIRINSTIYYDEIQADKEGNKRHDWAWNANGVISFRLTPTTVLQCNGHYISDIQTVQGEIRSRYRIDTGIKQQIFSGKGEITLQVNDWCKSTKEITIIDTPTLYKRTEKRGDNRAIWLGIVWNFNINKTIS